MQLSLFQLADDSPMRATSEDPQAQARPRQQSGAYPLGSLQHTSAQLQPRVVSDPMTQTICEGAAIEETIPMIGWLFTILGDLSKQ